MTTESTVTERVAKGAALLDEELSGWDKRIDVEALWMRDTCSCVLGQLYAIDPEKDDDAEDGYWTGIRELGIPGRPFDIPKEYGFAAETDDYPALDAEWKRVITGRRAAS